MRAAAPAMALLLAASCNQPVDGLDDTLRGCLVREDGSAAVNVPVFALRDEAAQQGVLTDAAGCFSFERLAPGRWEVAAHDFQGHGLLEAVHDVGGLFRPLGTRTLTSMHTDARWTRRRGLGLPEALLPATDATRMWCGAQSVTLSDHATVLRLDSSGAPPAVAPSVVEVEVRPPGPGRWVDDIVSLRWRRGGAEVPLPPGTDAWALVRGVTERSFLAVAGTTGGSSVSHTTWVYGASNQTYVLGRSACMLLASGVCVRIEAEPARVVRWNVDGRVTTVALDADGPIVWSAIDQRGEQVLLVVKRDGRLTLSRRALFGAARADTALEGLDVEEVASRTGPGWWSFVTTQASGLRSWVRVSAVTGAVEVVPLPERPADAHDVPTLGLEPESPPSPRLSWMQRDGEAWVVTLLEHLGGTVRERTLTLPFLRQPDFSYAAPPVGVEYFAGMSLVALPDMGLEVLTTGGQHAVLAAGASLDSGQRFGVPGFSMRPQCGLGERLISLGWRADLAREVQVMDVAPLARALGVGRGP
jgi:hypothetical protein